MRKMTIGAQLFTVREFCKDAAGLRSSLAKLKDIGFKTIQISGVGAAPEDVAKAAADMGMRIIITHMAWSLFQNQLDEVIRLHKLYNCPHTAIGGIWDEAYQGLAGFKKLASELGPVCERLAREGLDFSYHNHDHEFARHEGKTLLEHLFSEVKSPVFKAELDTYWVAAGGAEPSAWIRRMQGRMPVMHVKDLLWSGRDGDNTTFRMCPVGEGNLEWDNILAAANEAGVECCCVEQDNCYSEDPFDCLARSYRFLQSKGLE